MVASIRNGKRAETRFQQKAWTQAMYKVKRAAHFSYIVTKEKIKKKLHSLK